MPSFENPAAFFLLLLIPLLYLLRKINFFNQISFPAVLSDWEGRSFEWKGKPQKFLSALARIAFVSGFLIAVAAFADPVISNQEKVFTSLGTDIIFAIDTSPSMSAADMDGAKRIEVAKSTIYALSNQNDGCRYGLVAFGTNAAVLVPPTSDQVFFAEHLSKLTSGIFGDDTAIGDGLSTAVCHLASSAAPKKCIVLLTDGENNAGEIHPETAAHLAADNNITVYVVGLGRKGKVLLEFTDSATGQMHSGKTDSNFNPAPLKKIANIANGRYFEAQSLDELSATLAAVSKLETINQNYTYRTVNHLFYKQFLTIALILFAFSWFIRRLILKEMVCFRHRRILILRSACLFFSFLFLYLARLGLTWGTYLVPVQKSGHSVAMVFDISNSMLAKDCPGEMSRLDAAALYAKKLLAKMQGTPIAVVLAKGDGVAAIPLTDDMAITESLLDVMSPSLMTVPGSSIGKGILKAKQTFSTNFASAGRIWVFTDGEETDGQLTSALFECQKAGIQVSLIGFGSEKETQITTGDGKTQVMTALRSDRLIKSIEEASGKFNFFNSKDNLLYINSLEKGSGTKLLSQLRYGATENLITSYEVKPVPRYKLFLSIATLFLILSYIATEFNYAKFFKPKKTPRHRKAMAVAGTVLLAATLSSCSSETSGIFRGTVSYHKKNYRHSVSCFMQASETAAEKNDLVGLSYALYDLGTAYIMLGENSAAFEQFQAVPATAPDSVRYAAFYNAGVLAWRNSDFEEAQNYFRKALEIDSSKIEAKINLELSMQQIDGKSLQNQSQSIQANKEENASQDLEKAVFKHIKENDQKQWKNSESTETQNLAEDF
ncbi:MAG: VWA domain-containing protein [Treponema sp.]|nr:VWA domain-containing protein [Treponema sp.]